MTATTRHVTVQDLDASPWWIAHEWPERRVDEHCVWSWDCAACMYHLIAAARLHGDRYAEEYTVHGNLTTTTVNATLAAARAWRAEQGLDPL
jgi:hypothetical protein